MQMTLHTCNLVIPSYSYSNPLSGGPPNCGEIVDCIKLFYIVKHNII